MNRAFFPECPYCKKLCYTTVEQAKRSAARQRQKGSPHLAIYECRKGNGYHLTSHPRNNSAVTPKKRKPPKPCSTRKRKRHK